MAEPRTLSSETLERYLLDSLNWSGVDHPGGRKAIGPSLAAYRRVLGQGHYHLPFHLVHDLYAVISCGYDVRFRSETLDASKDRDTRRLRLRYEREFLGRLLQSPDVTAAMEIAQTSPQRTACLEFLLVQLFACLAPHYPVRAKLNPGLLRDFEFRSKKPQDNADALHDFESGLEAFLGNLNEHLRWGQLLHEEDLFELAHLETLSSDHLRVGCRQIIEASRRLARRDPRSWHLAASEVEGADTAFLDKTHYPMGGIAGLTNRGSLENLVTSELAYLDENAGGVSLFDLRHVEGELLYYLRDAGNLRRKRRTIHFVIDPGRVFENKPAGYDYQYAVLIQGMCVRLLSDLLEIFERDAMRFEFHYLPTGNAPGFLEAEIGIMRTVLADDVKHGRVRFSAPDGEALDLETFVDPARKSYAVVFAGPDRTAVWRAGIEALESGQMPLSVALIALEAPDAETSAFQVNLPPSGLPMTKIGDRKEAVLEALLS